MKNDINSINKIRIYVSVETGLEHERLEVVDLVHCINNTLLPLGICFIVDSKCDDQYEEIIKNCDLSLIIVCSDVSDDSVLRKRILDIYSNHPENHLYVFFNEPITPENKNDIVLSFRKYLGDMYGHFPVIKTNDEIRFELLLRLFDYAIKNGKTTMPLKDDIMETKLKTRGNSILFGKEVIADKEKIPCFSANVAYCQLEEELKQQQISLEVPSLTEEDRGRIKAEIFRIENSLIGESAKILDMALKLSNNTLGLNSLVLNEAIELFNKGLVNESIKLIDNHIASTLEPSLVMDTASKDMLRSFIPLVLYKVEHFNYNEPIQEETEYNEIETAYRQLEDITERINCEIVEKIEYLERFYNSIDRLVAITTEINKFKELLLNNLYNLCLHLEIDLPEEGKINRARIAYRIGRQKLYTMDFSSSEDKLFEAYNIYKLHLEGNNNQTQSSLCFIYTIIALGDFYKMKAKHQMRGINQKLDAWNLALEKYNEAIDLANKFENAELESTIYSRIGELYRTGFKKYDEALTFHKKSYNIVFATTNDERSIAGKCINLGVTYAEIATEKSDLVKARLALDKYKEALNVIQVSNDSDSLEKSIVIGKIYHNIGEIFRLMCKNSTDEALINEYRSNAIEFFEKAYSIRYPMARYCSNKYLEELVNTAESYSRVILPEITQILIPLMKGNAVMSVNLKDNFESNIKKCTEMLNLAYGIMQSGNNNVHTEYKKVKVLQMLYYTSILNFIFESSNQINDSYYDEAISICQRECFTDMSIQKTLENMNKLANKLKVKNLKR